mgnify:CR=1 FL=1
MRRQLLKALALSPVLLLPASVTFAQQRTRIAFGSCAHQNKPQPIWTPILADRPDMFVFLGDNIYADSDDSADIQACYGQLAQVPGYQQLIANTQVLATWDDHDYGQNDSGREYVVRHESRRIMLDFFSEPADSERRARPDGIYSSFVHGAPGQRVQIILLDLRWNRSPLVELSDPALRASRVAMQMGPYDVNTAADAVLVGEAQWQWLEEQLQVEVDLRIIGSSIQLLAEFTGWETWANYPHERSRLFQLLSRYQREPVVIISGDVHWCEYSEIRDSGWAWPLMELTSSGLTETWTAISPNRHRVGEAFAVANYGLIDIDWTGTRPAVTLQVKDASGAVLIDRAAR